MIVFSLFFLLLVRREKNAIGQSTTPTSLLPVGRHFALLLHSHSISFGAHFSPCYLRRSHPSSKLLLGRPHPSRERETRSVRVHQAENSIDHRGQITFCFPLSANHEMSRCVHPFFSLSCQMMGSRKAKQQVDRRDFS